MKKGTLSIVITIIASVLLLTSLFLFLGGMRAQAAPPSEPHAGQSGVAFWQQETYTPAVTITLPAANAILTTTHLPAYPVQIGYNCGTLCIGSAMLDAVSVTVDGGATYHEATFVSGTLGLLYIYDWPLSTKDYVSHTLVARGRNLWGNIGASDLVTVYVDTVPPQIVITAPMYTEETSFVVSWSATDGSGIVEYDLQYRRDDHTLWTDWITNSDVISRVFTTTAQTVAEGHTYVFRMLARDIGNNQSVAMRSVRVGDYYIFLPLILRNPIIENGDFESGDFTSWQHGGELDQSVASDQPYGGTYSALLGNPSYLNGAVPEGSAWITQTIKVPSNGTPVLSFWYRIFSYDVITSTNHGCCYDYLDVVLEDTSGEMLENLLRDGYTGPWESNILRDLGWRNFTFDLSAYRGQTIRIRFANFNTGGPTNDPTYNTYTYLDDIAIERETN
ncbi:MAG: fibronectin type III domain-containing protein [Chloroflexi bacterium]|nr:fibronectin type III domain-containing protein [Chloroflexota bacterium]